MMNEEQILLANAYLDGELTDAERRIAEADPAVMAEVGEIRALRAEIRSVAPPSDSVRESAITAAMAEFDGSTATAATTIGEAPAPAPVVPFRPRPTYARYLAIAAAVVGIGAIGVVVANLPTGGEDDAASDSAEEPAAADRSFVEGEQPAMEAAPTDDEMVAGDLAEGDVAASDMADAVVDSGATEEPAAEEPAAAPAAEQPVAEEPASDGEASGGSVGRDVPITTPEELAAFGAELLGQLDAGRLGATPNTACDTPNVLSRGLVVFDGIATDVLVAVDRDRGVVTAIAPDTCDVLLAASLPG